MTAVVINGNTYSDDGTSSRDMDNGGFRTWLLPMIMDSATVGSASTTAATTATTQTGIATTQAGIATTQAGNAATSATQAANYAAALTSTSTTSATIATGSLTLTTQSGKQYLVGQNVIASSNATPTKFVSGVVTSYSGTTLIINVTAIGGSGTVNDWNISISGVQGVQGATGTVGLLQTSTDFSQNVGTTTGLTYGYNAGWIRQDNVPTSVTAGTISLTASSTNYIEVSGAGVVSANTVGFTTGKFPIATATTSVSAITGVADKRSVISVMPSASGGGTVVSTGTNITLTQASAKVQAITTTTANIVVSLPDATTLTSGGSLYVIKNTGLYAFTIKDFVGNGIVVLLSGQMAAFYLADNSTSDGVWAIANENFDKSIFQWFYNGTVSAVSSTAVNTTQSIQVGVVDSSRILLAYYDNANIMGVVATISSGNTLSFGTPVICSSGTVASSDLTVLSSTQAIVCWGNSGTGNSEAAVITIAGTTLTKNATKTISAVVSPYSVSICSVNSAAAVMATGQTGTTNVSYLTISGTTIIIASTANTPLFGGNGLNNSVNLLSSTAALLTYQDSISTASMRALVFTISGTTLTANSPVTYSPSATPNYIKNSVVNSTKAAVIFVEGGTTARIVPITITGTVPSFGTEITYTTSFTGNNPDFVWNGNGFVINYANSSGYAEQVFVTYTDAAQTTLTTNSVVNTVNAVTSANFGTALAKSSKVFTVFRNGTSTFANAFITDILS